ncbi:hypothetical protein DFH06DRAFT_1128103 [Mycena polygramma]|nr:hypothetical protein DFH06DRAFT_1128103 [Mycena polygramma]
MEALESGDAGLQDHTRLNGFRYFFRVPKNPAAWSESYAVTAISLLPRSSFRIIRIHAERLIDGEDIAVAASGLNHGTGNFGPSRLRNKLSSRVAFGNPAFPLSNASIFKGIRQEMGEKEAREIRLLNCFLETIFSGVSLVLQRAIPEFPDSEERRKTLFAAVCVDDVFSSNAIT